MAIDEQRIKSQVLSYLNANERDAGGDRLYSDESGDNAFLDEEIATALEYAKNTVLQSLVAEGSAYRSSFIRDASPAHGTIIPPHYGTIGVPRITPYQDADEKYIKEGTRRSVEQIAAYRENPVVLDAPLYADVEHDQPGDNDQPSPLAGYYAVVEDVLYFTGFAAVVPIATIEDGDEALIPDQLESAICFITLGKLAKDGTISEKFGEWMNIGLSELNLIRTGNSSAPSVKPTVGARDSGTK